MISAAEARGIIRENALERERKQTDSDIALIDKDDVFRKIRESSTRMVTIFDDSFISRYVAKHNGWRDSVDRLVNGLSGILVPLGYKICVKHSKCYRREIREIYVIV